MDNRTKKDRQLIREALKARQRAYTPYSHYTVGAALEAQDGTVFRGCNIENASFGATNCAERTALFTAVAEGYHRFSTIAIVSGPESADEEELKTTPYPSPCGICRQALREFADPGELRVILARSEEDYKVYALKELLPESFGPEYL